jgi:hypothetical protein
MVSRQKAAFGTLESDFYATRMSADSQFACESQAIGDDPATNELVQPVARPVKDILSRGDPDPGSDPTVVIQT